MGIRMGDYGNPRGKFIVFEGIDGAGKTTQAKLLAERLRKEGHKVTETCEPGFPGWGEKTFKLVKDGGISQLAQLFMIMALRAENVRRIIKPALERGDVVVCDRWDGSSYAYQASCFEPEKEFIGFEDVAFFQRMVAGGLKPDLVLYMPPNWKRARSKAAHGDALERTYKYEALARRYEAYIAAFAENLVRVETELSVTFVGREERAPDGIAADIWEKVSELFEGAQS